MVIFHYIKMTSQIKPFLKKKKKKEGQKKKYTYAWQ